MISAQLPITSYANERSQVINEKLSLSYLVSKNVWLQQRPQTNINIGDPVLKEKGESFAISRARKF